MPVEGTLHGRLQDMESSSGRDRGLKESMASPDGVEALAFYSARMQAQNTTELTQDGRCRLQPHQNLSKGGGQPRLQLG